jgi:hypothetical protein
MRSPAPLRTNPFASRGQGSPRRTPGSAAFASGCAGRTSPRDCSGNTELAWPFAGGAPFAAEAALAGEAQSADEGPSVADGLRAGELALPKASGSPGAALINCASVAPGTFGGGIVPGCRARLRLTT